MSEEFQQRMFEPFAQEGRINTDRESSTGLGLSIVKRLVELMNGTLEFKSVQNEGTEFRVTLTHKIYHGKFHDDVVSYDASTLRGKRVLLCEDHPLNREIATRLLGRKGMLADTAENGLEAVELYRKAACGYYDLILMDLRMPVMDGITATEKIRALDRPDAKKIPIIALTANAFDTDVQQCIRAGMNAHISKPIEPEVLYATLAEYTAK